MQLADRQCLNSHQRQQSPGLTLRGLLTLLTLLHPEAGQLLPASMRPVRAATGCPPWTPALRQAGTAAGQRSWELRPAWLSSPSGLAPPLAPAAQQDAHVRACHMHTDAKEASWLPCCRWLMQASQGLNCLPAVWAQVGVLR